MGAVLRPALVREVPLEPASLRDVFPAPAPVAPEVVPLVLALPSVTVLLVAMALFENVLFAQAKVLPVSWSRLSIGESIDEPRVEADAPESAGPLPPIVPRPVLFDAAGMGGLTPLPALPRPSGKKRILLKSAPPSTNAIAMQAVTNAIATSSATLDVPSFIFFSSGTATVFSFGISPSGAIRCASINSSSRESKHIFSAEAAATTATLIE